ncbi:MAG: hypothetical protein ACREF4_20175, partial [Gammaproteobacteria bacterium]
MVERTQGSPAAGEGFAVSPERLAEALALTSAEQADILADGVLTFGEYESAVMSMTECVRERIPDVSLVVVGRNGEFVPGPRLNNRNRYDYGFIYHGSIEASEVAIAECKRQHLSEVEFFWAEHVAPSERDLQEARYALARCVRDAGEDFDVESADAAAFEPYRLHPTDAYLG